MELSINHNLLFFILSFILKLETHVTTDDKEILVVYSQRANIVQIKEDILSKTGIPKNNYIVQLINDIEA